MLLPDTFLVWRGAPEMKTKKITKSWTEEEITVGHRWRTRYGATTTTGFALSALTLAEAIETAIEYSHSGDKAIIALAKYQTLVTDGPTGFHFVHYVGTLDEEDDDISINVETFF